jgi:hypothetical protein
MTVTATTAAARWGFFFGRRIFHNSALGIHNPASQIVRDLSFGQHILDRTFLFTPQFE